MDIRLNHPTSVLTHNQEFSVQYRYYSKASQMVADLKKVVQEQRARHPERFASPLVEESRTVDGAETRIKVRRQPSASAFDRAYIQSLSRRP